MPTAGIPTTLDELEDVFRVAVEGVAPRYQAHQESRWQHHARPHAPGTACRVFRFEWDPEGYTERGVFTRTLFDATAILSIFVDYGGVPFEVVKKMAEDDHYQLRDVFNDLKATTDGLRRVEAVDWDFAVSNDGDQAQIIHQYTVGYLRARA
jgi:hypothetical protein